MKNKKRLKLERKEAERQAELERRRNATFEKVLITPIGAGNYSWKCPEGHGSFIYSDAINAMWGHPEGKAFCGVCFKYYEPVEEV